jgi:hypothetical protein
MYFSCYSLSWLDSPFGPGALHCRHSKITLRRTDSVEPIRTGVRPDTETPDKTQHSQETDIHASAGFKPTIPGSEGPQTPAATGIGLY